MKKGGYLFGAAMEAYGVKVCELVGAFLRKKLVKFVINISLDYIGMTV